MRTFNSTLAWMAALCFVLFACGEDDAPTIPEEPDTPTGLSFYLSVKEADGEGAVSTDMDTYWLVFDEDDRLKDYRHNTSIDELNATYTPAEAGRYTYMLAMSQDADALPEQLPEGMPLGDAFRMLKSAKERGANLLTGWKRVVVEEDELNPCTIRMGRRLIEPQSARLFIRLPEAVNAGLALRCVAEAYEPEKGQCVVHRSFFPMAGVGAKTFEVSLDNLEELDYDLLLWLDYIEGDSPDEDHNYITSSLKSVTIDDKKPYVAGDVGRRAYFVHTKAHLSQTRAAMPQTAMMQSPFAAYSVTCSDDLKYKGMQGVNDLPDWKDIVVEGTYKGYFPCAFNVWDGVPSDARTGQTFTARAKLKPAGGVVLFDDFVMAAGEEASFVTMSFTLVDDRTGEPFSRVGEVVVDYTPGEEINVVSGDYLTAGVVDDDMNVDDRWEGKIDVEF